MINRFQRDKSTLRGSICTEAAASYRRVIGVFSTVLLARVSSGVTLEGSDRWERKGMDGTREEEAADLTIWWGERRWCSAVALWGCWPST